MSKVRTLSESHWRSEYYRQRMTVQEWREVLAEDRATIVYNGETRQLRAKHLGDGIVEVYKTEAKSDYAQSTTQGQKMCSPLGAQSGSKNVESPSS